MDVVRPTPRVLKAPQVVLVSPDEERRRVEQADERRRAEVDAAFQAGVAAGRAAGVGALPELVGALDRAAAQVAVAVRERRREDAASLLGLAGELARWLVGRDLRQEPAGVLSILDELVDQLPSTTRLVVHVPVDLVDLVTGRWAPAHGATVLGDPALAPGEARLTTDSGRVELRFEDALAVARRALEGATP